MGMRYFEDLQVGAQFNTAETEVTEADIVAFARQYDPQAFHTDPQAALNSFFKRLVASGWHTAAITMRLMVQGEMELDGGVVGQSVDSIRWPRPTLPGDRLRVVSEVVEKLPAPARPTHGIVKMLNRTYNQHGKAVQEMTATLLVARRTPAG
jgi:acyl dehydratase